MASAPQRLDAPSLWTLLERRAARDPHSIFLIEAAGDGQISYGECHRRALDVAAWLHQQGVGAGTVVAWQLATSIEAVVLGFALSRLGAVQAPVIHLYREKELAEILIQARPQMLILPAANEALCTVAEGAVAALPPAVPAPRILPLAPGVVNDVTIALPGLAVVSDDPDPVRWYYFTSGTTAKPKGARHSDRTLMAGARFLGESLAASPAEVGSIGYPIGHIGGILYCAMAMMAGMAVVLVDRYVTDKVVAAFRRHGVTLGGGSTAHYQMLLAEQARTGAKPLIPSLRILAGGGAAKPAALFQQVREQLDATIVHAYGMTEAPISSHNPRHASDEQLTHTDGLPMPGLEVRIVDGAGQPVPVGQSGEILLRGPNLCRGYLDPEQTAAAFDTEGFYHTGDLGLLRLDGHLCVTGRLKDVIIRKGENISAREIEELLLDHPKVRDAAVIGLPDEERGELVCAVVELADPGDPLGFDEMVAHLASKKLMRQKIPERLEIIDRLPRNEGLQKVVKTELKARFRAE
jgi:acyl-CoA synthetase (AMP-forming)/AMP-acid ligase II